MLFYSFFLCSLLPHQKIVIALEVSSRYKNILPLQHLCAATATATATALFLLLVTHLEMISHGSHGRLVWLCRGRASRNHELGTTLGPGPPMMLSAPPLHLSSNGMSVVGAERFGKRRWNEQHELFRTFYFICFYTTDNITKQHQLDECRAAAVVVTAAAVLAHVKFSFLFPCQLPPFRAAPCCATSLAPPPPEMFIFYGFCKVYLSSSE